MKSHLVSEKRMSQILRDLIELKIVKVKKFKGLRIRVSVEYLFSGFNHLSEKFDWQMVLFTI